MTLTVVVPESFWDRVDTSAGSEACWPWTGAKYGNGYGAVYQPVGKRTGAHRVAWVATNKAQITDGLFVCHTCDNRICCNPRHLFLGTPKDNNVDRSGKGRDWMATGGLPPNAKLTAGCVREIRRRRALGALMQELAEQYGVSVPTISKVVNGHAWTGVSK